ncbi:MAG: nuclear transport factor 2 family protein [Bacteroidota bacterium]|nr:nuclear transport factor 2 family protein [Bacteroidota bacterium]
MKKTFTAFGVILLISTILLSCGNMKKEEKNAEATLTAAANNPDNTLLIKAANDSFYAALNAMFTGNLEPMVAIWSHSENITDMGPFGGRLTGWKAVHEEFEKEAAMKFGGKIVYKDLHTYAGTDMGYTVCIEEGENMSSEGKPVTVSHRATNIFHLENGAWKMVHHQTDLSPQLEKTFEVETQ